MALFVATDGNVAEAGGGEVGAEFIGGIGVHALDHLLPFHVIAREPVVLVDDDKAATLLQRAAHTGEALLYLGPEIDRLEGGDEVEACLLERQRVGTALQHLAAVGGNGFGVHLAGFLDRDR